MKSPALFGALAGLSVLAAPASAQELPVAPTPIDYVRICDAYGTRFFYLPGTETCLRVGGRIRIEYRLNNYGSTPNTWSNNNQNATTFRSRAYVYLDSRTATEYGLLRTYSSVFNNYNGGNAAPIIEFGFVQFGAFTFGITQSIWDFWTGYSYGAQVTSYSDTKSAVIAYTANLGNGVSASASIETAATRNVDLISPGANGYGGDKMPDGIANIRVEKDWGTAQVMGALRNVRFVDPSADGALGWAIGSGIEVNVPIMGQPDTFALQIAYSDGASGFPLGSWDSRITDAINVGGRTKTTRTYNIAAGLRHNFTKQWEANIEGSYNIADAATDDYDLNQLTASGNVVWKPVSGFNIGAEMQYRSVNYKAASGLGGKHEIYTTFRVQRTF